MTHHLFCLCLIPNNHLFCRQRREHRIFNVLLQMVPGLEDRLMEGSGEDLLTIAAMVSVSDDFCAVHSFFCS